MNPWLAAPAALVLLAAPAQAQHPHDHGGHGTAEQPAPADHDRAAPQQPAEQHDHSPVPAPQEAPPEHDHGAHDAPSPTDNHAAMMASMTGLYGVYPMGRDASGTSWRPDVSSHGGVHAHRGAWMLMGHALLNGVYDWQDGPRGDEKAFLAGMAMGAARRDFASGDVLTFRAMLSPDPFMGANGYPLLFAAGETADGVEPRLAHQ